MTDSRLFIKPASRDPLLWIWLLALPLSFQAAFWWEENVGDGVDSRQA